MGRVVDVALGGPTCSRWDRCSPVVPRTSWWQGTHAAHDHLAQHMHIGPGDAAEPVVTLMCPGED